MSYPRYPSPGNEIISLRDVEAYVAALAAEIVALLEGKENRRELIDRMDNELLPYTKLLAQCRRADSDELINNSHFEEYARELAAERGVGDGWPFSHIDWRAAIDELRRDFAQVDFDGTPYWIK